ncbi:unnamed protein product (mitochondrion) [Plasmodiophora brassicae]|uniref:NTF2 domain-containing protein n=1 Tax=Plasmodiophora brassicae TaxID=37360 RepID=A0A0G4IGY9_PLABS|nr:hypothetical protein PBRA_000266 [Plasmodiophora brassicae]SPQ96826.1 unnamed protein product [Plasmodiophora brassicae]
MGMVAHVGCTTKSARLVSEIRGRSAADSTDCTRRRGRWTTTAAATTRARERGTGPTDTVVMLDLAAENREGQPAAIPKPTPPAAPAQLSASVIASSFVEQYYMTLGNAPQNVHRFYGIDSRFARLEQGTALPIDQDHNVVGQVQIHEKIRELQYQNCKVLIDTIDFQESLDGSILVLVTGLFSNQGETPRPFCQSVVLARQERGFYVRNDLLRYTGSGPRTETPPVTPVAPGTSIPQPNPPQEEAPVAPAPPAVAATAAAAEEEPASAPASAEEESEGNEPEVVEADEKAVTEDGPQAEDAEPAPEQEEAEAAVPEAPEVVEEKPVEPAPKPARPSSWASLVRKDLPAPAPSAPTTSVKPAAAPSAPTTSVKPAAARNVAPATEAASTPAPGEQPTQKPFIPAKSPPNLSNHLFVQNLPDGVTQAEVASLFKAYGPIVRVELLPKRPFAFVVFESADGVAKSLQAKSIVLQGRELSVDQRKPRGSFGAGRGFRGGRGGASAPGSRGRGRYVARGTRNSNNSNSKPAPTPAAAEPAQA